MHQITFLKNIFLILLSFIFFISCSNNQLKTFTVKGKIDNAANKKIALISFRDTNTVIVLDSTNIDTKGNFVLKTLASNDELYAIQIKNQEPIWLVNDAAEIVINANNNNYKSYIIKGSTKTIELKNFISKLDSLLIEKQKTIEVFDSISKLKNADSILQIAKSNKQIAKDKVYNLCNNALTNTFSAALQYAYIFYSFKTKTIEPYLAYDYIEKACKLYATSQQLQGLKKYFDTQAKENPKEYLVNKTATDFNYYNQDSSKINLKTFSNKTLLINFWQTKNMECIKLNDKLKNFYKKYNYKNFDILSISLDSNTQAWQKMIKKDSLVWQHTRDTLYLESNLAKQYFVKNTPYNVLIKNGKIVAIDIKVEELKEKLEDLIK